MYFATILSIRSFGDFFYTYVQYVNFTKSCSAVIYSKARPWRCVRITNLKRKERRKWTSLMQPVDLILVFVPYAGGRSRCRFRSQTFETSDCTSSSLDGAAVSCCGCFFFLVAVLPGTVFLRNCFGSHSSCLLCFWALFFLRAGFCFPVAVLGGAVFLTWCDYLIFILYLSRLGALF